MEPLPVVSMDCSAEGVLRCLLRACHTSHGLLAFRPTDEGAEAVQQLRSRVATFWSSQLVRRICRWLKCWSKPCLPPSAGY